MSICAEYITLSNRFKASTKNLAQDVKKYIQENYAEKITLETLCNQFYCSKTNLTYTFKETYGETISQFIISTRLEKAEKLLAVSDMKIGEIASQCGFADQNYFCKVFSKAFGETPTAYRQNT
ncbi:MAG: AraC family transcriptional regulator [Niameybacter sp.]